MALAYLSPQAIFLRTKWAVTLLCFSKMISKPFVLTDSIFPLDTQQAMLVDSLLLLMNLLVHPPFARIWAGTNHRRKLELKTKSGTAL